MSIRIDANYENNYTAPSNARSAEKYNNCIFEVQSQDKTEERRAKTRIARYKAIQDSTLVYHKETVEKNYLFGIIRLSDKLKRAYYEYNFNGKETIFQIKKRFGIKDGALKVFNDSYDDTNPAKKEYVEQCIPSAGTKLRFYEYDVE